MNTYRPKYFKIQELVGPACHAARGDRAWELLQVDMLVSLDQLRRKFGPLTVNNWADGGQYRESGLRDFDTATGAKWSMHKFGGAADCKFRDAKPPEVSAYILANPAEFSFITTLENVQFTPTWLHFDCRNTDRQSIWIVNP